MNKKSPLQKLSLTEAVIAHLLRKYHPKQLYGLEMIKLSSDSDLQLKKGTIYVTLERMEKKGLVTSEMESEPREDVEEGKFYIPRRLYQLTSEGRQALEVLEKAVAQIPGFLKSS